MLSGKLARQVIDNTGLKGNYDFDLKWAPDLSSDAQAEPDGASIFTAIQEQLGLRLEPSRGPVELLVIDHAEKPTDN